MKINKSANCGTLQSNDVFIRIYPAEQGIEVNLTSSVMAQFGEQIEKVVRETLKELEVDACRLVVEDHGALDCTIKARVETAVKRAHE